MKRQQHRYHLKSELVSHESLLGVAQVILTWEPQQSLEAAALDGPQRRGGAAHPQTFKLPLAAGHRLHLTPRPPHLRRGAAGLQTPGDHTQKHTHHLQARPHDAQQHLGGGARERRCNYQLIR